MTSVPGILQHAQRSLAALWRGLHLVEDVTLVLLLLMMILLAVAQIVLRNAADTSLVWVDPFLRVAVLWMALLGASIAARDNDHISIDVATRYLPDRYARWLAVFTSLCATVICAVIAWYALQFVQGEREYGSMAFAAVPAWVCQAAIPAAFTLIAIRYLIVAVGIGSGRRPVHRDAHL
ncbi:MAG: TRAP transporter small permease [Pseudomonadota bacterium]